MTEYSIAQGDVIQWLRDYDPETSGYFTAGMGDPPYAMLENAKRFSSPSAKPAKGRAFARLGKGFMGQTWDGFRDLKHYQEWTTEWATELKRVCYPGALVALFGGSRTWHRLAVGLEDAGLEIVDILMWLYGSGMPHSLNIYKAMKKRGQRTGDETLRLTAERWKGWGSHLKPAYEPIIIARVPRGRLSYVEAAAAYQTGALNIDGSRIGNELMENHGGGQQGNWIGQVMLKPIPKGTSVNVGRYPSNVLLTHCPECSPEHCAPGCPVGQVDGADSELSGASRFFYSGKAASWERSLPSYMQPSAELKPAARLEVLEHMRAIEPQFKTTDIFPRRWVPAELRYQMEPARATHPTMKPLDLTTYLARLLLPPDGTPRRLLIPFSGVGSEMIGAHLAGWDIIQGIELTSEYIPQALDRLQWWVKHPTYESAQEAYNAKKSRGRKHKAGLTAEEKAGVRRVPLFPDLE